MPAPGSGSYENDSPGIGALLMGLLGAIPVGLGSIVGFRKLRRHRRRRCPACQAPMVCLAEAEDDALLEEGQQAEERVGSVDYDVWKCESCSATVVEQCAFCKFHREYTKVLPRIESSSSSSSGSSSSSSFGGGSSGGGGASRGY